MTWARRPLWRWSAVGLTVVMIAYGVVFELLPVELISEVEDGITSYVPRVATGMPVPALITSLVIIAVGVALWVKRGWWGLAVASLLALVGFGIGPSFGLPIVGQIAEVVLMVGLVVTEARVQRA